MLMLTERQRVILRQIVSPPYIYRWAGLLTTIGLVVGVTAVVLADVGRETVLADESGPGRLRGCARRHPGADCGGRPGARACRAPRGRRSRRRC